MPRLPRPTRDGALMQIAEIIAQRSTCSRAHVGVVIARDGRPLVTGYNGTPSGMPHCSHECNCNTPEGMPHSTWCYSTKPCQDAVHAEANAIAYASRWGIQLEGAEVFTTLVPCLPCAQLLVNSGITRVVYAAQYRDGRGLALLEKAGIALEFMG